MHPLWRMDHFFIYINAALLFYFSYASLFLVEADSPSAPVNVTVKHLKANSAVVTWDVLEDEVVIGFAISQQKKDVRMLRFIQEVNTTTRSCALWDLEEDTEYIVHVQSISIQGQSPASEPVLFKTPREAEKLASKNKDEVTMKEMGKNQQLRAGEILIIVVVLFMWAGSMTSSKITNQITTRRKPRARLRAALRSTRAEGSCAASFQKTSLQ
ncbi:fibronectin type III domain-containing protein 5 isoform X2 [Trachemys scripta elegans]|uniref:fibronectin type III domain-containing protein 5 isoform X2 n=1 Tax=Trachemys scripta elegans TaxID=31138 RepID=UPI001551CCFC|nr:fibronectin type III domain-containing protein 5 isoform X2 [Trachemys scripta elegans]